MMRTCVYRIYLLDQYHILHKFDDIKYNVYLGAIFSLAEERVNSSECTKNMMWDYLLIGFGLLEAENQIWI